MAKELNEWLAEVNGASPGEIAKWLADKNELTPKDLNALLAERTKYWPIGGQRVLHDDLEARVKIGAGGWRSGKSRFTGRDVTYTLVTLPKAQGWAIGADYVLARPEFEYVESDIRALGWPAITDLSKPQAGRWRMELSNGSWLETQTAEDLRKIEAQPMDVVALVEAGGLTNDIYLAAQGRVLERRGKVILSGRFRGAHSWYVDLWRQGQLPGNAERAISASIRTWENIAKFPGCDPQTCQLTSSWPPTKTGRPSPPLHGGFHNPEIQAYYRKLSEDAFGEMLAAEPRPDRTLVYGEWWDRRTHMVQMQFEDELKSPVPVTDGGGKIVGYRLPATHPLEVWVDPGYAGGYWVGVVQMHGPYVFVIDELFLKSAIGPEICGILKLRRYFPYIRSGVIDIAGTQHAAMPSQVEVWLKETGLYLRSQVVLVEEGIERTRTFLRDPMTRRPRIWFNTVCAEVLFEMEAGYRYFQPKHDEDPRADREKPVEKDNHACAALAYGLVANYGKSELSNMREAKTTRY